MQIDPTIFKAYDIRGLYPEQFNDEVAYRIARAFAQKLTPGGRPRLDTPRFG